MTKIINGMLSHIGLRVSRAKKIEDIFLKEKQISDKYSCGLFVECMGPSGIGKTTIVNAFKSRCNYQWNFEYEIGEADTQNTIGFQNNNEFYSQLLDRKTSEITSKMYSVPHLLSLSSFLTTRLKQDWFISHGFNKLEGGLWWDDGIFHNFTTVIDDLFREKPSYFQIFQDRILINFVAPVPIIIERLKKRAIETPNALNNWLKVYGSDEVEKHVSDIQDRKQRLFEHWLGLGGLGYTVNAEYLDYAVETLIGIESEIVQLKMQKTKLQ